MTARRDRAARGIAASALLVALLASAAGCSPRAGVTPAPEAPVLRIKGSDTMLILTYRWAERFMETHPGVAVEVEGGGSRSGIRALIEGRTEICAASRPVEPAEVHELQAKWGTLGVGVLCAKDALSIYLHPLNPVRNLTLAQVGGVLDGRIRDWSELGGEAAPIRVYGRNPSSGTHAFLAEHVLAGERYRPDAVALDGTAAIAAAVALDRHALGYGGIAYGAGLVHCSINGIPPTPATVRDGSYPITRYLYLYTAGPPRGAAKLFIDWVLSRPGQEVVAEVGYVPLWEL